MSLITKSGQIKELLVKIIEDNDISIDKLADETKVSASYLRSYIRRIDHEFKEGLIIKVMERLGVKIRIQCIVGKLDADSIKNEKQNKEYKTIREQFGKKYEKVTRRLDSRLKSSDNYHRKA